MPFPRISARTSWFLAGGAVAAVVLGVAVLWQPSGHGQHSHHEPGKHPGRVKVHDVDVTEAFTFRPQRGETCKLSYRLDEPARVSMRIKKQGTRELYLASIVKWELKPTGTHAATWDGKDYTGNYVDMSKAVLTLVAEKGTTKPGTMKLDEKSAEEIVHGHEWGHTHGEHHAYAEEVPSLRILEPAMKAELRGIVTIRCEVDKERRGYGNKHGYGVRYYVGSVLAHEEFYKPESDGKFTYKLDTTAFEDGEHMLYVGMCDHHEHSTSAGLPVVIRNTGVR